MDITLHKSQGNNCHFVIPKKNSENFTKRRNNYMRKRQTIYFENPVYIIGRSTTAGKKEGEGPIGKYFDEIIEDTKMGEKSFELAELRMLESAIRNAVEKSGKTLDDIDLFIGGDLLNQITTSSFVARDLGIPYIGVYSACANMTSSLAIAASLINAGYYKTIACATSSHFATAERQFRYPLEYGCQRPPYSQWTVTGAGCTILSSEGEGPRITMATIGKVADYGVNDMNNLGAAMAPAAMDTLLTLFKENNLGVDDFDLILTGDLGKLGSDILRDLLREQGYELGKEHIDCGNMIFDSSQHCYQGGCGAACCAITFNSYIMDKILEGVYQKVAFVATGALMSTLTSNQGETIPGIAHAVIIER